MNWIRFQNGSVVEWKDHEDVARFMGSGHGMTWTEFTACLEGRHEECVGEVHDDEGHVWCLCGCHNDLPGVDGPPGTA